MLYSHRPCHRPYHRPYPQLQDSVLLFLWTLTVRMNQERLARVSMMTGSVEYWFNTEDTLRWQRENRDDRAEWNGMFEHDGR